MAKTLHWQPPLTRMINFEERPVPTILTIFSIRFILALTLNHSTFHPDESWQGVEMAYKLAYGDIVPVVTTWEWEKLYSLRSVLYPLFLSTPLHFLRVFGLDEQWLVLNSITSRQ